MNRNIVSGVLSVASARFLTLMIGIVTSPLLYRMLGPARFGDFATVMSAQALFMIFVSAGITRGVRKYVAEDRYLADWEDQIVGFYFRLSVALAAAGAVIYVLAARAGVFAWLFDPTFTTYFTLMAGMVVVAQLWAFARSALMGFGLEHYSEPLTVVYRIAFATTALGLIWLGYGVVGALAGQILGMLIIAIIGMLLVLRKVSLAALTRPTSSVLPKRKLMTYNVSTTVLTFFLLSLYHVDVMMLQAFTSSSAVGNYKAALKLAEFLWFVPMTIQTVYVHSTSELWSKDHVERIESIASKTTRYALLVTVVMAIGLAALAPVVVPLYWGPEATPAITPLLLLLPGALGFAAIRPILAIEEGHGTLRYALVATGLAAVINFGLNFTLIPAYGMAGAAIATSVGYGSMFLLHLWSARRLGFNPVDDARLLRIVISGAVAAVPIFVATAVISSDLLALLVVPPLGLAVFLGVAFTTRALEVDECIELLAAFPAPIGNRATRLRERGLPSVDYNSLIPDGSQRLLLIAGLVLMVAASGIALAELGLGGGGAATTPNGTGTPTSDTAATTATDTQTEDDPFDDPIDTPTEGDPFDDPTDTATEGDPFDDPTDTPTEDDPFDEPTETPTDDDPFDEPTETPTESDTPTSTEDDPTDTETPTPTESDTPTPTEDEPTDTDTSTPTETDAPTEDDTPTDTDTSTDDDTTDDASTEDDTTSAGTESTTSDDSDAITIDTTDVST